MLVGSFARMPPSAAPRLDEPVTEASVETVQHRAPGAVAVRDPVEFSLESCREGIVHEVGEVLDQPVRHQFPDPLGPKTPLLQGDVAALLNRRDDRRVRRRAADTQFLQFAHQTRLPVSRRRLREMLDHLRVGETQSVAFGKLGDETVVVLARLRRGHARVAVEAHDPSARPHLEAVALGRHGGRQVLRTRHLTSHELSPDEIVESPLLRRQRTQARRQPPDVRRTDRLVRFLRCRLAGVHRRPRREVILAVLAFDVFTHRAHRGARQIRRIRAPCR